MTTASVLKNRSLGALGKIKNLIGEVNLCQTQRKNNPSTKCTQ